MRVTVEWLLPELILLQAKVMHQKLFSLFCLNKIYLHQALKKIAQKHVAVNIVSNIELVKDVVV